MTYGVNWSEVFRSAADITDKIFRGAKASEISIQQPTTFWLAINLKTAKAWAAEQRAPVKVDLYRSVVERDESV